MDDNKHVEITGVSQITISKKWIAICVALVTVFTAVSGAMFYVTATARPVSAEFAKEHPLK